MFQEKHCIFAMLLFANLHFSACSRSQASPQACTHKIKQAAHMKNANSWASMQQASSRGSVRKLQLDAKMRLGAKIQFRHKSSLPNDGLLRWSVAEYLPEKFRQGVLGQGREATDRAYGYLSLGRMLSADDELFDSVWPENDLWLLNQLRISPLRVADEDVADIIIVPAILAIHDIPAQVRLDLLHIPASHLDITRPPSALLKMWVCRKGKLSLPLGSAASPSLHCRQPSSHVSCPCEKHCILGVSMRACCVKLRGQPTKF